MCFISDLGIQILPLPMFKITLPVFLKSVKGIFIVKCNRVSVTFSNKCRKLGFCLWVLFFSFEVILLQLFVTM